MDVYDFKILDIKTSTSLKWTHAIQKIILLL